MLFYFRGIPIFHTERHGDIGDVDLVTDRVVSTSNL